MIPIYRNTLTRLDLSSVLGYMVENELEGQASGQLLVQELCHLTGYDGGLALRSPVDAVLYALELLAVKKIIVPVLTPYILSSRLQALGIQVDYYDIDAETMTPLFHKDNPVDYHEKMARLNIDYFGGSIDLSPDLPQEFLDLPCITLSWSLDKSEIQKMGKESKKQKNARTHDARTHDTRSHDDMQTPPSENRPTVPHPSSHKKRDDFQVVLLEHNTLLTGAGGAVLLVHGKKRLQEFKKKYAHTQSWLTLTDFNAGLALAQIKQMNNFVDRISKIFPLYKDAIQRVRHSALPLIFHPEALPQCFPVFVSSRVNEVVKYVRKQGIECVFPFQTTSLGMMMETLVNDKDRLLSLYGHGVRYVSNVIAFPFYPALDNEEVSTIVKVLSTLP